MIGTRVVFAFGKQHFPNYSEIGGPGSIPQCPLKNADLHSHSTHEVGTKDHAARTKSEAFHVTPMWPTRILKDPNDHCFLLSCRKSPKRQGPRGRRQNMLGNKNRWLQVLEVPMQLTQLSTLSEHMECRRHETATTDPARSTALVAKPGQRLGGGSARSAVKHADLTVVT